MSESYTPSSPDDVRDMQQLVASRSLPGYHTFDLRDYREFSEVIAAHFASRRDFVWRGHERAEWRLESSLARVLMTQRIPSHAGAAWPSRVARVAEKHFLNYLLRLGQVEAMDVAYRELYDKLAASTAQAQGFLSYLSSLPPHELGMLFELFAKAQHHWLKTPFLDWSESPFVALHFAFAGDAGESEVGHRVVYALNRPMVERLCPPGSWQPDGIYFIQSMGFGNRRITGQAGLFTFTPNYRTVEDIVMDKARQHPDHPVLLRFRVRNTLRKECLDWLRSMGISSRTLFPDAMGAALDANEDLERELANA